MHSRAPSFLRPVIELALGIARQGELDDPPEPAPAPLRPFLAFAKLPPAALEVARRVLDEDDDFRARVCTGTCAEEVGPAGWLWLQRPDGWQASLDALLEEAEGGRGRDEGREQRRLAKRQATAEAAAARLEAKLARAEEELERTKRDAAELRRANRQLGLDLESAEGQIGQLTEERSRAVRQLKAAEATLAERSADTRRLREEAEQLRVALAAAEARATRAEERLAGLPPPSPIPKNGPGVADSTAPTVDLGRASQTVADASMAAERLAAALADLAGILTPAVVPSPLDPALGPGPLDDGGAGRPVVRRRLAVRLPRAAVDDTPQAATYLTRLPGAAVLVDGYNVSKTAWPELDLAAQRRRLVNAVAELRNRWGTQVEIVFDGADEGRLATRALPDSVRVRFTPQGREADDVLLDLVDEQPPERPVVVVSSDRRVQSGARLRGASVLSSKMFLTVLR